MAVSGSQLTRIGGSLSGVGKKLTITAKAASSIVPVQNNVILQWNMEEQVNNNLVLQWNLDSRVTTSTLLYWNIANSIESSTELQWNIDEIIQQSIQFKWSIAVTATTLVNVRAMLVKDNPNHMAIKKIDQYLTILKG